MNWPIRFDTVKDTPNAMEVSSSGNWIEHDDYEKLLELAADTIGLAGTMLPEVRPNREALKTWLITRLERDAKRREP